MKATALTPSTQLTRSQSPVSWGAAVVAFGLWGGLAAGGAWLVLQGWPRLAQVEAAAAGAIDDGVRLAALRQVLQAPNQAVTPSATPVPAAAVALQVKVLGVVASDSGQGAALLQVGTEPPRPFAPGASVPGLGVVQSVTPQAIRIGADVSGSTAMTLVPPKLAPGQP